MAPLASLFTVEIFDHQRTYSFGVDPKEASHDGRPFYKLIDEDDDSKWDELYFCNWVAQNAKEMKWRIWLPGGWYDNTKNSAMPPCGKGEWAGGHNLVGVDAKFTDIGLKAAGVKAAAAAKVKAAKEEAAKKAMAKAEKIEEKKAAAAAKKSKKEKGSPGKAKKNEEEE